MRRASRLDANHHQVDTALQLHGWTTLSVASLCGPFDLLVADNGGAWVCEVKDGDKPYSDRKLTKREVDFLMSWPGPAAVVCSPVEAIQAGRDARTGKLGNGRQAVRRYVEANERSKR